MSNVRQRNVLVSTVTHTAVMIDLGTTEFRFAASQMNEAELKTHTTELFDAWETHIRGTLELPDYSLFLQVEEGSIKGGGAIAALLGALYFGIGNYGDFVQGLKTIGEQASSAGDYLIEQAPRAFGCMDAAPTVRRRTGTIPALQRLFVKVQRGEMSPDEAAMQAESLVGQDASTSPGFMSDLTESLRMCPRFHKQLPLTLEGQFQPDLAVGDDAPRQKRQAPPRAPIAPLLHIKIEIWRESKNKRKKSRISKV
jgi:hypothetical protein